MDGVLASRRLPILGAEVGFLGYIADNCCHEHERLVA
ncbi:hypothetical protein FHX48_001244 [Microbacterium halimionae]|uniref:Uncharacterized protein n=1 Tax=Microbacterium halimionae TaxID=1526413 RepID=A0A7W3JNM8_9MICO|nr:hypothetical protein [Microbacterium halimionae]NII96373.1 hypothetical protein [Microbacterium halimionae]